MPRPVSAIRNLGPATERLFAAAGMETAEDIEVLGADAAYRKLVIAGTRPHFIGYYALVMGLQGRLWSDCQGAEKKTLRARFDALIGGIDAKDKGRFQLETALDQFGVGPRSQPTSSRPAKK